MSAETAAAVRVFERLVRIAERQLAKARVAHAKAELPALELVPIGSMQSDLREWFGDGDCFVIASDLSEIKKLKQWRHSRSDIAAEMRRQGFASSTAYLRGQKTRCWTRTRRPMMPKHAQKWLPRYAIDFQAKILIRLAPLRAAPAGADIPPPPVALP